MKRSLKHRSWVKIVSSSWSSSAQVLFCYFTLLFYLMPLSIESRIQWRSLTKNAQKVGFAKRLLPLKIGKTYNRSKKMMKCLLSVSFRSISMRVAVAGACELSVVRLFFLFFHFDKWFSLCINISRFFFKMSCKVVQWL